MDNYSHQMINFRETIGISSGCVRPAVHRWVWTGMAENKQKRHFVTFDSFDGSTFPIFWYIPQGFGFIVTPFHVENIVLGIGHLLRWSPSPTQCPLRRLRPVATAGGNQLSEDPKAIWFHPQISCGSDFDRQSPSWEFNSLSGFEQRVTPAFSPGGKSIFEDPHFQRNLKHPQNSWLFGKQMGQKMGQLFHSWTHRFWVTCN